MEYTLADMRDTLSLPGFWHLFWFRVFRGIAAGVIVVSFPYFVLSAFNHGHLLLGIFYAVGTLVTAAAGFFLGVWFDRHPTRLLTIGTALLLAISFFIFAALPHTWFFVLLASALAGVSATGSMAGGGVGGIAVPLQGALVARLIPSQYRTAVYSLLTFVAGISLAIGIGISSTYNIETLFIIGFIASVASVIPLFFLPRAAFDAPAPATEKTAQTKALFDFSITGLLNGFSQGLTVPFLIPLFIIYYQTPRGDMSWYSFAASVVSSGALLLAPWFDRRWGLVQSMIITRGAGIIALLCIALIRFFPLAIFLFIIFPTLRVIALPIQQRAITDIAGPADTGTVLGANQGTRLVSASIGSAFAGYLFERGLTILPFYGYAIVATYNLVLYKKFFGKKT